MKRCGLPQWLYLIMACFFVQGVDLTRSVDLVDYFGGACGLARTWNAAGSSALSIELKHDNVFQNVNGAEGFITCLLYGSKVRPGGMGCYGVVCSTWIWMCLKSTGRHLNPMGNQNSEAHPINHLT